MKFTLTSFSARTCFWFAHSTLPSFSTRKRGWKPTCFAKVPMLLLPALNWLYSSSRQCGTPFCNLQKSPLTSTSFDDFSVTKPQMRGYFASWNIYSIAGQGLPVSLKMSSENKSLICQHGTQGISDVTDYMLVTLNNALGTFHVKIFLPEHSP